MAPPMPVFLMIMAVARVPVQYFLGNAHERAAQRDERRGGIRDRGWIVSEGSGNSDSPYTHINWRFPRR